MILEFCAARDAYVSFFSLEFLIIQKIEHLYFVDMIYTFSKSSRSYNTFEIRAKKNSILTEF